ncbi:MAG: hypothetical protein JOS17DRAFT_777632 [Linnemannia elongata]|nr:MAG: hypothetical protein JOS17DRAFT_777632 [Linnemannia elongata]
MEQEDEDEPVLQALRLVRLDSLNTSSPGGIVHIDTHLDPLVIDAEPASLQEHVIETSGEPPREQSSNTEDGTTNTTSSIQQESESTVDEEAAEDNGVVIDNPTHESHRIVVQEST